MEIIAVVALVISLLLVPGLAWVFYLIHLRTVYHVEQGWINSNETNKEVRNLLAARVSTLENRVMSNNWGEFANLQSVPTELDKGVHADSIRHEEERLVREAMNGRIAYQGDDLEGESDYETFEGPTVG